MLLVEGPLHTGQATGEHRAERHAQFPPHRTRPEQQAHTTKPQHRHLQVLRPVIQAGRLATAAGPADRPLREAVGGGFTPCGASCGRNVNGTPKMLTYSGSNIPSALMS